MTYSIHPKIHRLQHEILTLERHLANAQQRLGMTNPKILQNYKNMIQSRKELINLLHTKHEKYMETRIFHSYSNSV